MIKKEDFYCGAFLSFLLNNRIVPALFEERKDNNRKIYQFSTNRDDFRVYVKYSEKPSSRSKTRGSSIWNFPFTKPQIEEIRDIAPNYENFYFVFICGSEKLNESKIAVASKKDIFKCIDINIHGNYKSQNQTVRIRLIKNHWDFDFYGTERSDKLEGKDNTIKVRIRNIEEIFGETEEMKIKVGN